MNPLTNRVTRTHLYPTPRSFTSRPGSDRVIPQMVYGLIYCPLLTPKSLYPCGPNLSTHVLFLVVLGIIDHKCSEREQYWTVLSSTTMFREEVVHLKHY